MVVLSRNNLLSANNISPDFQQDFMKKLNKRKIRWIIKETPKMLMELQRERLPAEQWVPVFTKDGDLWSRLYLYVPSWLIVPEEFRYLAE